MVGIGVYSGANSCRDGHPAALLIRGRDEFPPRVSAACNDLDDALARVLDDCLRNPVAGFGKENTLPPTLPVFSLTVTLVALAILAAPWVASGFRQDR